MTNALTLHVLGQVRAQRDGQDVPLGGAQRRALFALLVVNLNKVVSTSLIVDTLWPDQAPAAVGPSIHVAVSGLRAALVSATQPPAASILRVASGYQLAAPAALSDLARFQTARDIGMRALGSGQAASAAEHLTTALAQWSGQPLDGVSGARLEDMATSLAAERLDAMEARLEAELQLGRHTLVVTELAALVQEAPLRESAWGKYMVALYRCQRQAEALDVYNHVRTVLRDELGIDPGQALESVHTRILRHDPSLDGPPPGSGDHAAVEAFTERGDLGLPSAFLVGSDGQARQVDGSLSLGRVPGNTIQLHDPRVSRMHATIHATAAGYVLADLHSTNGTYLDGALLMEPTRLQGGETIRIGDCEFVFQQQGE